MNTVKLLPPQAIFAGSPQTITVTLPDLGYAISQLGGTDDIVGVVTKRVKINMRNQSYSSVEGIVPGSDNLADYTGVVTKSDKAFKGGHYVYVTELRWKDSSGRRRFIGTSSTIADFGTPVDTHKGAKPDRVGRHAR